MSSIPSPSTSRSNLDSIFTSAFQAYKEKTGKDITSHPLAAEIQACHSPDAILAVLRRQIPALGQPQSDDEGSTKWLVPTANVLYSLSATLGEGVGLVNAILLLENSALMFVSQALSPAKVIFTGIGVLLLVGRSFNSATQYFDMYTCRLLKMSAVAKIFLSICSTGSSTFSVDLRFTRRFHLLRL